LTVLLWLGVLVGLGAASTAAGSNYNDSQSAPSSESTKAIDLLRATMPAVSGDTETIVWHTDSGTVRDNAVQTRMSRMLGEVSHSPGVGSVVGPYSPQGASQVSKDGKTAYAQVIFAKNAQDIPDSQVKRVITLAEHTRTDGVDVQLGGRAVGNVTQPSLGATSEIVGISAALIVMLLVFRSGWAAVMPVLTGVAGVGTGLFATMLLSHAMSINSIAPTLGTLIGLGVGIDYALFIVNRHRQGLMSGLDVPSSITRALSTSGRAVVFAGLTVVIALFGMFALGLSMLNGMAIAAALTVILTVAAAITLLPALLGLLKLRVLSRSQRRQLAATGPVQLSRATIWERWAGAVQARPIGKAAVAVVIMAAIAVPVFSVRLGSSDAGNDPKTTTTRQSYDLLAKGFGPGFNGPLSLVAETASAQDRAALATLAGRLEHLPGVAQVVAAPATAGQRVSSMTVVPTTSPQSAKTSALIKTLRHDVIPQAEQGTTLRVLVGGPTAISEDFTDSLVSKMPLFIVIIVGLGCLLMMVAFRSVLVPLIGLAMNLLTMGAGFGVLVAVFQWGWGSEALGAGKSGPIEVFVPILVIAIVFGLSMDYQVFLISRMHEEWGHSKDNRRAVRVGHGATGQVITAAGIIMGCVFASFAFGGQRVIAEFGVGLATAVLLDVFMLRMVLVPALMHRIGPANWWLPRWLDRALPRLAMEGDEEKAPEPPKVLEDAAH